MAHTLLDPSGIGRFREALATAGYTSDGLAASRHEGGPEPGSRLDTLLRVFEHVHAVSADLLAAALAPLPVEQAVAAGIFEAGPDGMRATLHVQPYQTWWVMADLPRRLRSGPPPGDHVLGVAQAPVTLARAVVRRPVRSALDLCCGSGVQSLHLSTHAERTVATDLSARALSLAATTAALNGLEWQLLHGDFLVPVAGRRFDLVVCNPPFVIGPGAVGHLYRDSGMPGDRLGAYLAAAAPSLLDDGGYMHYAISWAHIAGQEWTERVAGWVTGTGMDAWIARLDVQDLVDYVSAWSTDPGSPADRDWLGWLRRQHIEAVSTGLVSLRNTGRSDPVIRTDDLIGHQILEGDVSAWFARQDGLRDRDLLSSRFRAVEGLRLESSARLSAGTWHAGRHKLTTPHGPCRTDEVSDLIVAIVAGCDGSRPLGEQLSELAAEMGIDSAELRVAAVPAVARLVEHNMIEPVPPEVADTGDPGDPSGRPVVA